MHDLVTDFLDSVRARKAENTFKRRRADLRHFEAWREAEGHDLTAVDARDLRRYLEACAREGFAAGTIRCRHASVRLLYKHLAFVEAIESNPFYDDHGDPIDHLDPSEFTGHTNGDEGRKRATADIIYADPAVVEAIADHVPSPVDMNELLVRLLFQTGVRAGEAAAIRLDDLDRDARAIDVTAEKTGDKRTVHYHPSLDPLLAAWLDGGGRARFTTAEASPYLFVPPSDRGDGTPKLAHDHVNNTVREGAKRAGIQETLYVDADGRERYKWTAHTLRHGFAVNYLKCGGDVRTLQKLLGHRQLETTMQYLEVTGDDVAAAYRDHFDPGGPPGQRS